MEAFGINAYRATSAGDPVIEAHVESPGQEELYLVVAGSAEITVGDEAITASAGTAVFVPDPTVKRGGKALEREAGEHRDTAIISYRLACCHARLGETDLALNELCCAIEINGDFAARAQADEHFASIHDHERWPGAA